MPYAHAQQEEIKKKETSTPIPKKYLEYEVCQGAYVWRWGKNVVFMWTTLG